jgi:hypothetical protein
MNLLGITLIGCVIYFSEYRATKKAVVIAVILAIVSMCLGVTEGVTEPACNPCKNGDACGPGQLCPDRTECDCPGGTPATCTSKLTALCPREQGKPPSECFVCAGQQQEALEKAGCQNDDIDKYCDSKIPVPPTPGSDGIPIDGSGSQNNDSIQLVNGTSQDFLHVFLESHAKDQIWTSSQSGAGASVGQPVKYNSDTALPGLGAKMLSEAIIPKGSYIVVSIPATLNDVGFRVTPLKQTGQGKNGPSTKDSFIDPQWPITTEITWGANGVANTSAVDGINFRMDYKVTTSDGIKQMTIHKNPCTDLDPKYHLGVGCRNPTKIDCDSGPMKSCLTNSDNINWCGATATCKAGTQKCKLNECTDTFFNIPNSLINPIDYHTQFDMSGNAGTCQETDTTGDCPVKKFVMDDTNLKNDGALKKYCNDIQSNNGDFTTYCYDYDDQSSSPIFAGDHKIKIKYMDL